MAITHSFVSGKGDDPDATLVDGTAWDAAHTIASDTVTEAMLSTADNTTKDASASKHGFLAKVSGSSGDYVGGDNACHALPGAAGVFFNVKDAAYGAVGDGDGDDASPTGTEDYEAVLDAVQAAYTAGGGWVYFPTGTYRMSTGGTFTTLDLRNYPGVKFCGDGLDCSWIWGNIRGGSNQIFQDLKIGRKGYEGLYIQGGYTDSSAFRCEFRGGGGGSSDGGHGTNTVRLGGTSTTGTVRNITFRDCRFQRPLEATYTGNCIRVTTSEAGTDTSYVENVLFDHCHIGVTNGIATGSARMGVEIWGNGAASTRTKSWKRIDFIDCIFEKTDSSQLDYAGLLSSADSSIPLGGWSTVKGCLFKGCGDTNNDFVLQFEPAQHMNIVGNTFWKTDHQWVKNIYASDAYTGNTFVGNTFDGVTDHGESITKDNSAYIIDVGIGDIWSGNIFHLNTQGSSPAILLSGANIVFSNNRVVDEATTTSYGYLLWIDDVNASYGDSGGAKNVISGNYFHSPRNGACVTVDGASTYNLFHGNYFDHGSATTFDGTGTPLKKDNFYAFDQSFDA